MTEKTFRKIRISLLAGICAAVMAAQTFGGEPPRAQNMSLFFPQFLIGGASEKNDDDENEKIQVEYTFRIAEIFRSIFG